MVDSEIWFEDLMCSQDHFQRFLILKPMFTGNHAPFAVKQYKEITRDLQTRNTKSFQIQVRLAACSLDTPPLNSTNKSLKINGHGNWNLSDDSLLFLWIQLTFCNSIVRFIPSSFWLWITNSTHKRNSFRCYYGKT